ncbi:unnamed protein product [Nezara viridula]|uniref:glycerol-3-phosphate dehydrogenase n=1 Tax=Nezara viridula TaxID=85310 RepID=A0A9P0H143_NEZVI|nr:unnamed protein product [Nezara viridula]
MATDTVDAALKAVPELATKAGPCITDKLLIEGDHGWTPTMYIRLVQDFGLECEVAQHLAYYYGDRAFAIRYGVREYAMTAIDMIARRLRLSFLNVQAAREALPLIVNTMAEELHWDEKEKQRQTDLAIEFLMNEMGEQVNRASKDKIPIDLTKDEVKMYIERFRLIDQENKGYISINDMRRSFKNFGDVHISGEELHEMLREIDTNMNGQVELDEYLQVFIISLDFLN